MKKGFLLLVAAMLLAATASAQFSPTLAVTNGPSYFGISWSTIPALCRLQTATSLTQTSTWSDVQDFLAAEPTVYLSPNLPQQYYRVLSYIPIFEFDVFYNVNLEINFGSPTFINGPVFCNQNIWEYSSVCEFESTVTAVGTNALQAADPFATDYNGSGYPTFTITGQPTSHAKPLGLYNLGTNYNAGALQVLLGKPPLFYNVGSPGAYSSNGLAYFANSCDLVVSNFAAGTNSGLFAPHGTNLAVYYQDSGLLQIPYDFYTVTNSNLHTTFNTNYISATLLGAGTNIYYAGFSWLTNTMFGDWREGWKGGNGPPKQVQAVQMDMNLLQQWLTNTLNPNVTGFQLDQIKLLHTGHHIDSVYVYSSVPLTTAQMPAVRVMNGGQLPHPGGSQAGLTVTTPLPIYVWKDYNCTNNGFSSLGSSNTAYTLPAALIGDAITVLSDGWLDSVTSKLPNATNTTVNAAMITGTLPSNGTNCSGGVENAIRLLENWSGNTLTFNGSIVVPYYSQIATNTWQQTGQYYTVPTRKWALDKNFASFRLPPLTPYVENNSGP